MADAISRFTWYEIYLVRDLPGKRLYPDGLEPEGTAGNGAVAQLGERELCKLEVIGSIPFSSTTWFCLTSKARLAKPVSAEALAKADWRHLAWRPSNETLEDRSKGT